MASTIMYASDPQFLYVDYLMQWYADLKSCTMLVPKGSEDGVGAREGDQGGARHRSGPTFTWIF